ncbi:hypothetical protein F7725_015016 [Dissostichus mawsoni]|uniref:Uncharacterized protein n=1 Tax=Dissostichus mawsoni TaxID=36200 RepID=A0A7J5YIC4_DISMA|nr:hypothetical protein F7725_015016 [Dissostichus mawsoni]
MEQIVTVEETQIKDKKCILLRIKGGKQFVLQCERPRVRAVEEGADGGVHRSSETPPSRSKSHREGSGRSGGALQTPLTHRNSNGL